VLEVDPGFAHAGILSRPRQRASRPWKTRRITIRLPS
jgi:hypothetical protein